MARLLWLIAVVLALLVPGGAIAQKPRAERPTYTVGEHPVMKGELEGVLPLAKVSGR
jgi:hypothetical protein